MSINKIKLIKAEIERLKSSLPWGSCASQISMECDCKDEAYNEVLSFIDSLEEDPVSEDLEKEIQRYYNEMDGDCRYMQTARHFARWQKRQVMKDAVEAVIHPYDGEIWVDKDLLSIYDDCQRVKLIIIEEE